MTGYGEASGETAAGSLRVEIRTVNHRYLNVNTRLPAALARWEGDIREWLRDYFARGHVNCVARWEANGDDGEPSLRIDEQKVSSYLRLFAELGEKYGVAGDPDLAVLTRFNDIFSRTEDGDPSEVTPEEVRSIVRAAAEQAVGMRAEEGRRLDFDLRERVAAMEGGLAEIESLAPARLVEERQRLHAAVADLLGDVRIDEQRLAQEVALIVERWDVNEELVRFRSHNQLFTGLLEIQPPEPVGKRLSFLVQEMHREANTIGSKANNAKIAHLVVAIKDELERLREQVENVE